MEELIRKLPAQYATLPNLKERLYLGISILENYAHTQMEDSSTRQYDMDALKNLSIQVVNGLLSDIWSGPMHIPFLTKDDPYYYLLKRGIYYEIIYNRTQSQRTGRYPGQR